MLPALAFIGLLIELSTPAYALFGGPICPSPLHPPCCTVPCLVLDGSTAAHLGSTLSSEKSQTGLVSQAKSHAQDITETIGESYAPFRGPETNLNQNEISGLVSTTQTMLNYDLPLDTRVRVLLDTHKNALTRSLADMVTAKARDYSAQQILNAATYGQNSSSLVANLAAIGTVVQQSSDLDMQQASNEALTILPNVTDQLRRTTPYFKEEMLSGPEVSVSTGGGTHSSVFNLQNALSLVQNLHNKWVSSQRYASAIEGYEPVFEEYEIALDSVESYWKQLEPAFLVQYEDPIEAQSKAVQQADELDTTTWIDVNSKKQSADGATAQVVRIYNTQPIQYGTLKENTGNEADDEDQVGCNISPKIEECFELVEHVLPLLLEAMKYEVYVFELKQSAEKQIADLVISMDDLSLEADADLKDPQVVQELHLALDMIEAELDELTPEETKYLKQKIDALRANLGTVRMSTSV